MDAHNDRVAAIAASVASFYKQKKSFRNYHGSTNSTRTAALQRDAIVDTSGLGHVISIDREKKSVLVEPNVGMGALVDATLAEGLVPPVVMEFPGITAGGGFSGTAGESSSFRHQVFERTVRRIEIVLADGRVLQASREDNTDLLDGAAGAFGSLGVITLLEIDLVPATTYVEVEYIPYRSVSSAVSAMRRLAQADDIDFLDAIVYSPVLTVIMAGRRVNGPHNQYEEIVHFDEPGDPWFYQYVEDRVYGYAPEQRDLVPLRSYLFRYDRGGFWAARLAFGYFLTPFNMWTRRLLDPLLRAAPMYHAMHRSGLGEQYIVQDVILPLDGVPPFVDWLAARHHVWPLWLCPLLKPPHGAHVQSDAIRSGSDELVCNVGVWGGARISGYAAYVYENRLLEATVRDLGGIKTLYAQAFYTRDEFATLYETERWAALRNKYNAGTLPGVFERVCTDGDARLAARGWRDAAKATWPVGGLWGVWQAAFGGDYLLARSAAAPVGVAVGLASVVAGSIWARAR